MSAIEDKQQALSGNQTCNWRAEEIVKSQEFRKEYASRPNVITAEEMPWERSPDGLIKHLIHRNMNTPELCVEAYMLFLKAGERSGKHRHMWEELAFVVEGEGYDLHWDMSSTARTSSSGNGTPSPRSSSGSRATTSTCRPTPTTRASRPRNPASS